MSVKRYDQCVTRLENRGFHPPTREYVDGLVAGVLAAGVEACCHSAVDQNSRPLFPSKVFPNCHPQANFESFRYLLDRLHGIGRPVLSWYGLGGSAAVLEAHPDWAMKLLLMDGSDRILESKNCCYTSPYTDLLARFAAEVVTVIGFDGIWFDGSTMTDHGLPPYHQPGCVCDFCRERFRRDTGLEMPGRVDYENKTFRIWVNWRYAILMEVWKKMTDAILAAKPEATVAFNNYRRRHPTFMGWNTAIPMRRLDWDALMSCELDGFPTQGDIQTKILNAYRCQRGTDTWWPLYSHAHVWVPDNSPLSAEQAMVSCVSAGGSAFSGIGVDARLIPGPLKAMQKSGAALWPYRQGRTVEYAAIWASQQTQDFFYKGNVELGFNQVHGANELCQHAHVQSSVVFDDDVAAGDLAQYPVLLLPNCSCVSRQQAERLQAYVAAGGVLFATGETGTLDELGYPHPRPVLDDLLGIRSRAPSQGSPTLEFKGKGMIKAVGMHLSFGGRFVRAEPAADVELIAKAADRTAGSWDGIETHAPPFERVPILWRRRVGKGWIVYCGSNIMGWHLTEPVPATAALFRKLLDELAPPPIVAQAPLCVTINSRRLPDGRIAVVLHNAPGTAYRYPTPARSNFLHAVGEVIPVSNIRIRLNGLRCRSAVSGITGKPLKVSSGATIRVPRVKIYEVALLTVDQT
jgi:hypothetical protein